MTEKSERTSEYVVRLPNIGAWVKDQIPEEFFSHMRAAQREQLLAMRTLIDAALERNERRSPPSRARTEITVE